MIRSRLCVGVDEGAADLWHAAQGRKERGRDRQRSQLLGPLAAPKVQAHCGEQRARLDGAGLLDSIEVVRNRDGCLGQGHSRVAVPDEDEAVRILVGQRSQQHLVEQREDGRRAADAHCYRRQGDEREHRLTPQDTNGQTKVGHDHEYFCRVRWLQRAGRICSFVRACSSLRSATCVQLFPTGSRIPERRYCMGAGTKTHLEPSIRW